MSPEAMAGASDPALSRPFYLLEEISHRVVNEYAAAIYELSLAARAIESPHARVVLDRVAERLHVHAEAHRALLAPSKAGIDDLVDHLGRICAAMSRALLAEHEVRFNSEVGEVWMGAGGCWRVGLIVAELVRNAVRHGLAGRAGVVRVVLTRALGCVHCIVTDNGSAAEDARSGHGRRLVEMLAADLGGEVSWRFTPAGCIAKLAFPDPG